MTVSEVIDWYQKHIEEFEEVRAECESLIDEKSVRFHEGAIFGLRIAITVLERHRKDGLEGEEKKV